MKSILVSNTQIKNAYLTTWPKSRFEVLTATVMKSSIIWDIISCSPWKIDGKARRKETTRKNKT
jgi:hypothetical protein